MSRITKDDLHWLHEGRHVRLYDKLGAHFTRKQGKRGVAFAVWAPNAAAVSVVGDWNGWEVGRHPLSPRGEIGVWEGFVAGLSEGARYKYHVRSRFHDYEVYKADPLAFAAEAPPETASVVTGLDYDWGDGEWMASRAGRQRLSEPVSIYEVHPGSWRRNPDEGHRLTYRELAHELADYVHEVGFTHVELLPVMEHPFYGSWGYQGTGYFAPTARYGSPRDFMYLVDHLHRRGIGVILDWVPSHFPTDQHGLGYFDGTHLYEHADPRKGFHPDWKSFIFNYGRNEVRSFLLSSARFWLDHYHVDGLRVDAVASMLYLDYSREDGEWIPNEHGGRENLEAVSLLRELNEEIHESFPGALTIAEESTAWPMVSRPTYVGGLGFDMKWDMGWMHDTLRYLSRDPLHRNRHHHELTFRRMYAYSESFVLALSHDEVVHGKGSLLGKMPGDDWQKRANLRLLFAYMTAQPGKKLLFMGGELGQHREWDHDGSLDWHLLERQEHAGIQRLVADLNRLYREEPALHEQDCEEAGFDWIDADDVAHSVLSFLRRGKDEEVPELACVFNFTPVVREGYRIGLPRGGRWREVLNTDAANYGGSGQGNLGGVDAEEVPCHGRPFSAALTLPPLGAVLLRAPTTDC